MALGHDHHWRAGYYGSRFAVKGWLVDDKQREIDGLRAELAEVRARLAAVEASDAAERRHFEEALETSERSYREIFNAAMTGICVHEIPSGRVLDANQAILDMFGCSRDEVFQMAFWRRVSAGAPHTPAEAIRVIRKAASEGQQVVQWPVRRKNGERFWVEVVVKRAVIGGVARVLVLMNDITDRRRAEEALKVSEQNYREIFNASMNSIAIVDVDTGRFLDVNQAMLDMHGVSRDEALRLTIRDISIDQSPATEQRTIELLHKAVNEGPQKFEWHCKRGDGQTFWVEVAVQRVVLDGVPRALALATDITDRKRARQRLLEEQDILRNLLESQERERRLIAYEIHDGVAQQLAAAAMYCSAFERLRDTDPEEATKLHEAGAMMLQEALAETRRLIGGLRPAVLDESGLVAAVENLVSDVGAREGIEVEFLHDVRFERLNPISENSLFRIVQESLTNAARHSGTRKIRVRLVQEVDRLTLEIQDWGSGFDPADVSQERFGLKGIRERAGVLGGRATIESSPGAGTRIRVELPLGETKGRPV